MKTIVIGGNFAGFTAALELKRKGNKDQDVMVIDKSADFLFIPSLIWVPFKRREVKDITIPKAAIFRKKGVEFLEAEALKVDPATQLVYTTKGNFKYDQLVVATGPKVKYDVAPGVAEHAHYIGTPAGAMKTRAALDELKKIPARLLLAPVKVQVVLELGMNFYSTLKNGAEKMTSEIKWIFIGLLPKHFWVTSELME